MWQIERDLGSEKLYRCSECGFQLFQKGNPPAECPNCGEISPQKPRSIDLNKSNVAFEDSEVDVYEYERETPVYKLWYFWVILILMAAVTFASFSVVKSKLTKELPEGSDTINEISFTPPTGWTKEGDNVFVGPGEGSEINIISCKTSRFADVEEYGELVQKLANVEKLEDKTVNGIEGKYVAWKTRKIVDNQEYYTDYARYVFIDKGVLYVVMYRSSDGTPEAFDAFLESIKG